MRNIKHKAEHLKIIPGRNLIALPLNGLSIKNGNSCFINPETFEPYPNQWEFLKSMRKVTIDKLKEIYQELFYEIPQDRIISLIDPGKPYELEIIIKNQIFLKRRQLGKKLIVFLRDQLNFFNSDYLIKKNLGISTYATEKYFNIVEESDEEIMIPRGFSSDLVRFCKKEKIMTRN